MGLFSSYTVEDLSVWSTVTRVREQNEMNSKQWPDLDFWGLGGHGKEFGFDAKCHRNPRKSIKHRNGVN